MKKLLLPLFAICLFAGTNYAQLKVETAGVKVGAETTPVEALDVNGAVKLGTTANSNAGTLRWTGTDFEGYDGSNWLKFAGAGSSMWSNNNGEAYINQNVGIGTNDPVQALHIQASGGPATMMLERADASNFSTLTSGTVGNAFTFKYDKRFLFTPVDPAATNIPIPAHALVLFGPNWPTPSEAGNVGIGVESPSQKLHVNGNVLANNVMVSAPFTNTEGIPVGRHRKRYGLEEVMRLEPREYLNSRGNRQVNLPLPMLKRVLPDLIEEYTHRTYKYENNDDTPILDKEEKRFLIKETEMKYLLINAIQDQQEIINKQAKQISSLEERLVKLEKSKSEISKSGN